MTGLFARHLVRCHYCGGVLRECDNYCPACLAERTSSRIFQAGTRTARVFIPLLAVAGVLGAIWVTERIRLERELERQSQAIGSAPAHPQPTIVDNPDWQKWIHTPTR